MTPTPRPATLPPLRPTSFRLRADTLEILAELAIESRQSKASLLDRLIRKAAKQKTPQNQ